MSDCGLDGLTFKRPSLCKPQFAAESNISTIVQRFLRDGVLPEHRPDSGIKDATALPDSFEAVMDKTVQASQAFEQLSFEERQKYNNSVDNWLAALEKDALTPPPEKPADPPPEKPADPPPEKPAG